MTTTVSVSSSSTQLAVCKLSYWWCYCSNCPRTCSCSGSSLCVHDLRWLEDLMHHMGLKACSSAVRMQRRVANVPGWVRRCSLLRRCKDLAGNAACVYYSSVLTAASQHGPAGWSRSALKTGDWEALGEGSGGHGVWWPFASPQRGGCAQERGP